MAQRNLPPVDEMFQATRARDPAYDGLFYMGVRTTGIFCRPTCPAKKPRPENVEFYPSTRDALLAGFRPCKRCRPMELNGKTPAWMDALLRDLEEDPARRWTDADLRARALDPGRVRRWFRAQHGMTFHAYQRARRLGVALGQIRQGDDLTRTAYATGWESLSGFRDAFQRLIGDAPGRGRSTTLVTVTRVLTPLGPMVAGATDAGICLLEFADRRMLETQLTRLTRHLDCAIVPGEHDHLTHIAEEMRAYFAGTLQAFTAPLVVPGTPFQRAVWDALRTIPYGTTTSYDWIARTIGNPKAVRAVGRANGDNRIAVVIPCHRVVGADGRLVGYGGGLWRKQYLLELERGATATRAQTT